MIKILTGDDLYEEHLAAFYSKCQKFCPIRGGLVPSFRRTPESSLFKRFWTPAFAGVTGRENVIIFGNCYKSWSESEI